MKETNIKAQLPSTSEFLLTASCLLIAEFSMLGFCVAASSYPCIVSLLPYSSMFSWQMHGATNGDQSTCRAACCSTCSDWEWSVYYMSGFFFSTKHCFVSLFPVTDAAFWQIRCFRNSINLGSSWVQSFFHPLGHNDCEWAVLWAKECN